MRYAYAHSLGPPHPKYFPEISLTSPTQHLPILPHTQPTRLRPSNAIRGITSTSSGPPIGTSYLATYLPIPTHRNRTQHSTHWPTPKQPVLRIPGSPIPLSECGNTTALRFVRVGKTGHGLARQVARAVLDREAVMSRVCPKICS